jgi:hypothetical protein
MGGLVEVPGLFRQGSDFSPQFLPDGRRFLYRVRGTPEADGIYVGQLDGKLEARRLLESVTRAVYTPSGYVLFVRQKTLLAQRFDPDGLHLTGNPFRVTEDSTDCGCLGLSVSDTGSVVYRATASTSNSTSPGLIDQATKSARQAIPPCRARRFHPMASVSSDIEAIR